MKSPVIRCNRYAFLFYPLLYLDRTRIEQYRTGMNWVGAPQKRKNRNCIYGVRIQSRRSSAYEPTDQSNHPKSPYMTRNVLARHIAPDTIGSDIKPLARIRVALLRQLQRLTDYRSWPIASDGRLIVALRRSPVDGWRSVAYGLLAWSMFLTCLPVAHGRWPLAEYANFCPDNHDTHSVQVI
jgi:hypothetical protein